MKKIPFLVLSLVAFSAFAGSDPILDALNDHQRAQQTKPQNGGSGSAANTGSSPDVIPSNVETQSASKRCDKPDQTSMPLKYLTSLFQVKDGKLNINYDGQSRLDIESPDMISNCNSMFKMSLQQPTIKDQKVYAVEAKFVDGKECSTDDKSVRKCKFKVDVVDKGVVSSKEITVEPTLTGFKQCLTETGVIGKDGKINSDAIANGSLQDNFSGISTTAPILFMSTGPQNEQIGSKYADKFPYKNECVAYEPIHPEISKLMIASEARRQQLDKEAAELKTSCKDYGRLSKFIQDYEEYYGQLSGVRDELILNSVKDAAAAIEKKKYKPAEVKTILDDFNKYWLKPRLAQAELLAQMIDEAGDEEKPKLQEKLDTLLAEIKKYSSKPYITKDTVNSLIAQGDGDNALVLSSINSSMVNFTKLGKKEKGNIIDIATVKDRIAEDEKANKKIIEDKIVEIKYQTGEESGNAEVYANKANGIRQAYNDYVTSKMKYIYDLSVGMQQECNAKFTGTLVQSCQARYQTALTANIEDLKKTAPEWAKKIQEADALADKWAKLEFQGSKNIAKQNGEEAPTGPQKFNQTELVNVAQQAQNLNGAISQNQQQMQQQQQFQQQQQMYQPSYMGNGQYNFSGQAQGQYGYQQQQPYLGQQAYGYYGQQQPYNFNWNGGYQQQQQPYGYQNNMYGQQMNGGYGQQQMYGGQQQQMMPYYQQPYGAYNNNYSLYNRRW